MAGASSGWMKTGAGAKGKAFVSSAGIRAYYSRLGKTATDADVRAMKDYLRTESPANLIEDIAKLSTQPTGQAKTAAPPPVTIPQRSQADRQTLADRIMANQTLGAPGSAKYNQKYTALVTALQRIVDSTELASRVPQGVLDKILVTGFQNQHQTGTSKGLLNPAFRAQAEYNMFGIAPGSPPDAFPFYGYLAPLNEGSKSTASSFGSIKVVFKDAVRDRTTFSVGDSLYDAELGDVMPSPLNAISITAAGSNAKELIQYANSPTLLTDMGKTTSYMEAQIHGPTTAADIARVVFSWYDPPKPATLASLDRLGIPYTIE